MTVPRGQLRVSDAERQAAAQSLGAAFRDGRLDVAEYEDRVARAYGAVTFADVDRLFTDLPRPMPAPQWPAPMPRYPRALGSVGQVRGTAVTMLLFLVT